MSDRGGSRGPSTPTGPPQSQRAPSYSPITPPGPPQSQRSPNVGLGQPTQTPTWPIQRGYIILRNWTPTSHQQNDGYVEVTVRDEGQVIGFAPPPSQQGALRWIRIEVPRRRVRGLIPWDNNIVKIGPPTRIYGQDLKVEFNLPPIMNLTFNPSHLSYVDLYPRTVMALCLAFADKGTAVGLDMADVQRIQDATFRTRVVQAMTDGARRSGALQHLNTASFSLSDLENVLQPVGPNFLHVPGIYMQVLARFPNNPNRPPEIRVGTSNNIWRRECAHQSARNTNMVSSWYTQMRTAGRYVMYPLLHPIVDENVRSFAEQFTVLQLGSYRPDLLRRTNPVPQSPQTGGTITQPRSGDNVGKRFFSSYDACTFSALAEKAFQQTGWVVATKRQDFGCFSGHNSTSPITEQHYQETTTWTRTDVPGIMAVFRRRPVRTGVGDEIFKFKLTSASSDIGVFAVHMAQIKPDENGPREQGEEIFLSVEITLDGSRHPYQWARLRDAHFAPWSDWEDAAGLAIRLDWQDSTTGKWYKRYYQTKTPLTTGNKTDYANVAQYGRALALRRMLLQQNQAQGVEGWRPDKGPVPSLKTVTFDNLNQVFKIQDIYNVTTVSAPTMTPLATLANRIRTTFNLTYLGATWRADGSRPNIYVGGQRTKCDFCIIQTTVHACKAHPTQRTTCISCWLQGLPCSWTLNLRAIDTSRLAPPPPAEVAKRWVDSADPQFQFRSFSQ